LPLWQLPLWQLPLWQLPLWQLPLWQNITFGLFAPGGVKVHDVGVVVLLWRVRCACLQPEELDAVGADDAGGRRARPLNLREVCRQDLGGRRVGLDGD